MMKGKRALFLLLILALFLSLPARARAQEDGTAPTQSPAPSTVSPIFGPYTVLWTALIIGAVCLLLALAIFWFTGRK